jgi:uncharacterized membrane protein
MDRPLLDAAAAPAATQPRRHRLLAVDLLRGAIMIVMSWDHSRDFLSRHAVNARGSERWSGVLSHYDDNVWVFLQRWISHFCAPGFFFTMGFAMHMLAASRAETRGWTAVDIIRHFAARGCILLIVGRLVDLALAPMLVPIAIENQTLFPPPRERHANATP